MRKFVFLFSINLLMILNSYSQINNLEKIVKEAFVYNRAKDINDLVVLNKTNSKSYKKSSSDSSFYNYNIQRASEILKINYETISIKIPKDDGDIILDLVNFSEQYLNVNVTTGSGNDFNFDDLKKVFYRGVVRDKKGSSVAVTITGDKISALILTADNVSYLSKTNSLHSLSSNFTNVLEQYKCVVEDEDTSADTNNNTIVNNDFTSSKIVKIYYETEYDVFESKGSVLNVLDYITTMHNEIAIFYFMYIRF